MKDGELDNALSNGIGVADGVQSLILWDENKKYSHVNTKNNISICRS